MKEQDMQQWEYEVVESEPEDVKGKLNALGKQGYELMGMYAMTWTTSAVGLSAKQSASTTVPMLVLKRRKQ
jgi:hypothetical protein